MATNQIRTGRPDEIVYTSPHSSQEVLIEDHGIRPELPSNIALVRDGASDATIRVQLWDINGRVVVNSDNSESVPLTIGSTAKSLAKFLADVPVNASATVPGIPNTAVGGKFQVLTGGVRVNTGGTDDGTGTNGLRTNAGPGSATPEPALAGDVIYFGRYRL